MTKWITITDIVEFKPLSLNINVAKFLDPYIIEAQEFDIKPILGTPLFLAIDEAIEDFDNLFLPYTYEYSGHTYNHNGIKSALIYYTYARYLANANQHSTPSGMMQKLNEFSTNIDEKTISRLVKQAQSGAIAYQNQFIEFLCRFSQDYPLYNINGKSDYRKTAIRIRSAGV